MTTHVSTQVNGVNVDQLMATINAIKDNPDLARFQFRAHTEWLEGGQSRTTIKDFYGAGQEDTSTSGSVGMELAIMSGKKATQKRQGEANVQTKKRPATQIDSRRTELVGTDQPFTQ
jgi:hypothetical protein